MLRMSYITRSGKNLLPNIDEDANVAHAGDDGSDH